MAERVLSIRTPEGIVFALPVAALPSRALAMTVDLAVVTALSSLARAAAVPLAALSADAARALLIALYFAISVGYGIFCEWFLRGQTIGKRLLKLRVVDATGLRLTPAQVIVRNLLRPVDALPFAYLAGGVASFLSRKGQRLGDLAAGTTVIAAARRREPDLSRALGSGANSLEASPHVVARLRQRVSPELAAVALSALVRRERLEPAARVELFAAIAEALRGVVPFPDELTEGLSDEQLVRNSVDVLFRAARA